MATKTERKSYTLELDEMEYGWVVLGLLNILSRYEGDGVSQHVEEIEDILRGLGEID